MRVLGATLAMALGLWMVQAASAGEECCGGPEQCGRCGCHSACQKYCKIVPDVKEIKKHVWVVKCEDFCAPLPGRPCHSRCGDCGECGECGDGCGNGSCGKCDHCGIVRTKKTLEKKEITCKIPCWKCVVVYACGGCGEGCVSEGLSPAPVGEPTSAAPLPPAPKRPLPPPAPKSAGRGSLDYEPRLTSSMGH